jgi:hypothetical protein
VQYTFVKTTVASSSVSDRSLIHNGKRDSTVLIGYTKAGRGDGTHPVIASTVSNDRDVSKDVTYQGTRVETIDATNEYVPFRLLQGF